ncbi:MAG: tetratricopeptide repeat protein [Prevotella sp.]|jgi:tetratricopeptide (TPR) repeat protein|nr:tetratricopeptide repeat protein [Prevotella sp.]
MAKSNKMGAAQEQPELNSQEAFFLKYRKQIIAAVVAVIVVIAGCIVYNTFIAGPREEKASTALAKAQDLFAQGEYQKALTGDKQTEGLIAVTENYGGTDAANLANAYAGLAYAQLGKWQDAVKYLEEFSTKGDAMISPAVTAALGNAYANTGNIDKAISTLKKAAEMADDEVEDGVNNSLSPTYLIQAARLLESQGKKDEALKIYKDIKVKYINSVAAQDIDKYIERIGE